MGLHPSGRISWGIVACLAAAVCAVSGCQAPNRMGSRLYAPNQVLDTTGLSAIQTYDVVKAEAAPPQNWQELRVKKTLLYTDMQWRSPSKLTGVGVTYIVMPLPLPAETLVWFAKQEYSKHHQGGKMMAQWTDDLGRVWFEGEDNTYHIRGYAVTKGFEAWIAYVGYRLKKPPVAEEVQVAERAQATILPTPLAPNRAQISTASAR